MIAVLAVLGAFGAVLAARSRAPDRRSLAAVTIALVAPALVAAAAPGVGAVPALTRALHYLPAAALGLALPAGVAAAWLVRRVGRRWRIVCAAAIAIVATASAATASAGMVEVLGGAATIRCCTAPRRPAGAGWVAVVGPPGGIAPSDPLALTVFARTGAPLLYISRPRIRFPDIYLHIPAQAPRFDQLRAVAGGGAPPPQVSRILAPAGGPAPPGFRADASCRVATYGPGTTRTVPYRWYVRR